MQRGDLTAFVTNFVVVIKCAAANNVFTRDIYGRDLFVFILCFVGSANKNGAKSSLGARKLPQKRESISLRSDGMGMTQRLHRLCSRAVSQFIEKYMSKGEKHF